MKPTKGFTGKKHSLESRRKMSESRKANHPAKKLTFPNGSIINFDEIKEEHYLSADNEAN